MTGVTSLSFAPLVPWEAVVVLAAVGTLLLIFGMGRGARGCLVRLFVLAVLSLGLLNPHLESESRDVHPDIALVVVDGSSSQNAGKRPLNLRRPWQPCGTVSQSLTIWKFAWSRAGRPRRALFYLVPSAGLSRICRKAICRFGLYHGWTGSRCATLDEKRTDGSAIRRPELDAPLHVLLTGQPDERDRRLIVEKSPAFGIVGKKVTLKLRIEDQPSPAGRPVGVAIRAWMAGGHSDIDACWNIHSMSRCPWTMAGTP